MPIALAIPFAEAAGIAIAGLSAAAIADKVSEYIKLNPEDSMTIFKMITPASAGEGLSTLFKKKAKKEKEEEPSIEDLEEIGEDLSQADKAKVMKAYGKSKGAGKRQRMIDIATKLGLAGEGKERQKTFDEVEGRYEDSDFEEERPKPKFDYTKFFKANGGRIGYQEGGGIINSFQNIINETLGNLYNRDKISQLEYNAGRNYGYTNTASGPVSDFRHQAAMNELSKSLSPSMLSNVSFIPSGDTLAFGAGLINEIPALFRGLDPQNLKEIGEDIVSNFKGTYLTSNKETPESIYQNIFSNRNIQTANQSPNLNYGIAQAADFQNGQMLKPADKFDDQGRKLVSESMVNNIFNNEAYNGEQLKAAFGDNVSFVSDDYYSSAPNFNADVLREEEDAQYNLPKTSGIINSFLNMKDAVPQMLLGAATKIPGAGLVLGGLNSLGNFLGNTFENRQLTGDGVIVDEFGRSYNADELNAQNALGGYYTEAARSSRRRDASIRNMLARQAAGKAISETRLAAFQEQAAREEAARQAATARQAAQNAATYGTSEATGGYQSSWGGVSDFMSGSGTSADMGSFANGGLATMFRRR